MPFRHNLLPASSRRDFLTTTSKFPNLIWLARQNRSELLGEGSFRNSCFAWHFVRYTACLACYSAFWCSSLLPPFCQVFQHVRSTVLSTAACHHQVSFLHVGFLITPHTFSSTFSKLEIKLSQISQYVSFRIVACLYLIGFLPCDS